MRAENLINKAKKLQEFLRARADYIQVCIDTDMEGVIPYVVQDTKVKMDNIMIGGD